mmetsp:Transcript_91436/g.212654  ORF Transcript_91436/g.212654 Transcript_91436/m.212654 type:complete len:333 (+) Transcript_91436:44-1042(+)
MQRARSRTRTPPLSETHAPGGPFKTAACAMSAPSRGSLVEAYGLKTRADLNGVRGVLNGRVQDGRLGVDFPPPEGTKAMRLEQLVLLREGGERAPMPQHFPAPVNAGKLPRQRLLAYGDSLTAGYWCHGRRFSPYAATLVSCLLPDITADAWVCGLSSLSAEELVEELDAQRVYDGVNRKGMGLRRVLREHGPFDLALIMAGTNDLGDQRAHPDAIHAHTCALHDACHREGVETVALSVPPNAAVDGSERYCKRWQRVNSLLSDWVESNLGKGVLLFVDTNSLVPFQNSELWEADNLHLSRAGSARLGEGVATLLKPVLSKKMPSQTDETRQ